MPSCTIFRNLASRLSGEWSDDDYDVLADGAVVGRIFKVHAAPGGAPWMWTLAFGHHEDRTHRLDTSRLHRSYLSLPSPRGRLPYANRLRRPR